MESGRAQRAGERRAACERCGGCGRIGGSGQQERPWCLFRGVPIQATLAKVMGMQRPRTCPDCAGSGRVRNQE
jgi:DnaJ-class molecular chaperone